MMGTPMRVAENASTPPPWLAGTSRTAGGPWREQQTRPWVRVLDSDTDPGLALKQGIPEHVPSATDDLNAGWKLGQIAVGVAPTDGGHRGSGPAAEGMQGPWAYWAQGEVLPALGVKAKAVPDSLPAHLDWDRAVQQIRVERDAYEQHKEEILGRYEGQYVAVLNGTVIDSDGDYGRLAERVFARLGRRVVLLIRATRESGRAVVRSGLVRASSR